MNEAYSWRGRYVIDSDGDKIGKLEEIYPDQTGNPEWAIVDTGLLGTMSSFVPLAGAAPAGEDIQVPFSKQHVKDAPGVPAMANCRGRRRLSSTATTASEDRRRARPCQPT